MAPALYQPEIYFLFLVEVQFPSSSAGESERNQIGRLKAVKRLYVERLQGVVQIRRRQPIPSTVSHELDGLLQHLQENGK